MALILFAAAAASRGAEPSDTVIDQWDSVKAPPPPKLARVEVSAKDTALLILDIEKRTTNMERRPRAVASVPRIAALLAKARAKGMRIVFSTTSKGTPGDILEAVKPAESEAVVTASVDKFHDTALAHILRYSRTARVIVVGTAAEGAVLHTATAAAVRGLEVVVPVDAISSSTLYAEQYVVWHLVNAPGSKRRTSLTRTDWIAIAD